MLFFFTVVQFLGIFLIGTMRNLSKTIVEYSTTIFDRYTSPTHFFLDILMHHQRALKMRREIKKREERTNERSAQMSKMNQKGESHC